MAIDFQKDVLDVAVTESIADSTATQFYDEFLEMLSGQTIDSRSTVQLECEVQQTSGDSIESAIRKICGDVRKNREKSKKRIDVVFQNTIIEVKYGRKGFKSLATDSQGLRPRTDKWYLYVVGEVVIGKISQYVTWFMRADKLFDAVVAQKSSKAKIDPQLFLAGSISSNPIDRVQSLKDIEAQIDIIQSDLARAIFDKASGDDSDKIKKIMSLDKKVGINRIRFDLKFEQLIRSYIYEIIHS